MSGGYTVRDLFEILVRTASRGESIEQTVRALDSTPSSNGIRYHLEGKTGGTRALLVGRKSYATDYTINSAKYGSITCQMRVVCGYHKGFKGQHGIRYLVYAVHPCQDCLKSASPLHRY